VTETTGTPAHEPLGTITVSAHRVGEHARTGEILEILGEPEHEHYRVRWEDGREAVVAPSSDAVIRRTRHDEGGGPDVTDG
jgi:hypothetical protein